MKKFFQRHYKKIIIFSLALTVFLSVLNAKNDSLIYDEDAHIPAGYSYLKTFDMRLNPEHPPLLKDLSAFPLLFINPTLDTTQDFWEQNPNDAQWNSGKSFLFESGNDPDQIIFWSRLPIILIFALLAIFIFKWTWEISSLVAALLAFILFTFDPNILGHNHYVTTDLGIAAFITFVFYYFIKFIKDPTWKNIWILGIFLALVQLTKFSSVLIFPVFGLILIIYALTKIAPHKKETTLKFRFRNLWEYLWKFIIAFGISLIIIWIAYFFTTFNMPQEKLPEITNYYFAKDNIQGAYAKQIIFTLNDNALFRPMAIYIFGIFRVFQRVAGGNVTYFLGEISTQGFYSYFPVVFMLKTPLSTLILLFSALGIGLYSFFKSLKKRFESEKFNFSYVLTRVHTCLHSRTIESLSLLFIFVYCFTSITGRLNIGFRHLFPIVPFIYILTSKTIFNFIKNLKTRRQNRLAYGIVIFLSAFLIFNTIKVYPNYVSYFNIFAGGPKNGYQYVTDSNADWGQDLKRLKNWIEEYNHCAMQSEPQKCNSNKYPINSTNLIDKIRVDYFGLADLNYYLGKYYESWWASRRPIEEGYYAISTLFLQEGIYDTHKEDAESYRWLKNKKPFHQVGTSILIYKITSEDLIE